MELGLFQLVACGLTVAWITISFILDKKTGTSVMAYALYIFGVLLFDRGIVFWGSIAIITGTCMLILFFLIYKNEHNWTTKKKDEE